MRRQTLFAWLIAIAVILRIFLIFNPGFEADIAFWKSWGLATYDKGIVEGIKVSNNNYPTPFAYVLGSMVWVYSKFADPHDFEAFWTNTNLLFLVISKLYPILADIGIASILFYIGRYALSLGFPEMKRAPFFGLSFYELLPIAYLLSPLSLIDGAWWGQVDALGLFVFLLALLALLKTKHFLAGFLFVLAMMVKLQNMIYGPVFFLFVWQTGGFTALIRSLAGATIGFFGLNIEFLLSRNMDRVLASLTENFDYFPWMSLNAYNLWWIVSGARGMQMSDKILTVGITNAKTVGLLLFSCFYLFAVLQQLVNNGIRKVMTNHTLAAALPSFLVSLIVVNASFFLFQTQSHDRYMFPLSVFLLLWAPFYISQTSSPDTRSLRMRLFTLFYFLFTTFYFYNLHTALVINYPHNGLPVLSLLTQPIGTIMTSYVLLGLFGVFIMRSLQSEAQTIKKIALIVGAPILFVASFLLAMNYALVTKQTISLTKFTPYISEQAYGTRQTNRSVQSSFGGPNGWTRLSSQYVFYAHGFGTHANSKMVFDIGKKFKTFTTDYGIDTESGIKASAIFEIWGDNTLLFRSPIMGRYDLPKHIEVDVTHIRFLQLRTTDAGDGNFDDHTDWLNPRLDQ